MAEKARASAVAMEAEVERMEKGSAGRAAAAGVPALPVASGTRGGKDGGGRRG